MNVEFVNPRSQGLPVVNAARVAAKLIGLTLSARQPVRVSVYRAAGQKRSEWIKFIEQHDRALGRTIILDSSTEGHPITDADLRKLAASSAGLKVIVLTQNTALIDKIREIGCDELRGLYFHAVLLSLFHTYWSLFRDATTREAYIKSRRRIGGHERRYTCLMYKARPQRLAIFGWLRENGYLPAGAVSFHAIGDPTALSNSAKQLFPSFSSEVNSAASYTGYPYVNFPAERRGLHKNLSFNVTPYEISPLSLVVETDMAHGQRVRRYTEKSVKAILACHRFVICGNANTLSLLRSTLDAETFGQFLPEGYDSLVSPDRRLRALLKTMKTYLAMSESDHADFLHATWPICEHNFRAFPTAAEREVRRWFGDLEAAIDAWPQAA